jgi:hypothetical protein
MEAFVPFTHCMHCTHHLCSFSFRWIVGTRIHSIHQVINVSTYDIIHWCSYLHSFNLPSGKCFNIYDVIHCLSCFFMYWSLLNVHEYQSCCIALLLVISILYQLQIHCYHKLLLLFSTRTLILLARTWCHHLLKILMMCHAYF